jgi:broad specificity phosphatase PhoE
VPRLYLVRHGESEWNAEGRLQGQADPALSPAGRAQARGLALPAAPAVMSDLTRAAQTAALAGFPDAPADPRWRERTLGEWETYLEREVATPEQMAAFRRGELTPPGGETWEAFQERVAAAAAELERDTIVFTHGGCVRAVVSEITGADYRAVAGPANASITVVRTGKLPRMLAFNWTASAPGAAPASDPGAR